MPSAASSTAPLITRDVENESVISLREYLQHSSQQQSR